MPLRHRGSSTVLMLAFFWAIGSVFTVGIAIATLGMWKWRYFLLVVLSPLFLFLAGSYWFPESPRYLLATGKTQQLEQLLTRMSKLNRKSLPAGCLTAAPVKSKPSITGLFTKELYLTSIVLSIMYFTLHYAYHGIVLLTTSTLQMDIDACQRLPLNHTLNIDKMRGKPNS